MRRLIADALGFGTAAFSVFSIFTLGVVANESVNAKKKIERLEKENAELTALIEDLADAVHN